MARLSEARHFYKRMMKRFLVLILLFAAVVACKTTPRTYGDAEREFRQSLTFHDTITVMVLGQNFMDALLAGDIGPELAELCVLQNDTLYRISDKSVRELRARFVSAPVSDYKLASYTFSTPGINDLCYRYTTSGDVNSGPAFKLMFNPVKVGDDWFLTLKDGSMSSQDMYYTRRPDDQSPAPLPIVLNLGDK